MLKELVTSRAAGIPAAAVNDLPAMPYYHCTEAPREPSIVDKVYLFLCGLGGQREGN